MADIPTPTSGALGRRAERFRALSPIRPAARRKMFHVKHSSRPAPWAISGRGMKFGARPFSLLRRERMKCVGGGVAYFVNASKVTAPFRGSIPTDSSSTCWR